MINLKHGQVRSFKVESIPWWVEYRRQQYKPRPPVSLKKILRSCFIQVFKEYMQQCSVAGVKQIIEPNVRWRKCAWIGIFVSLLSLVFYFFIYTWQTTISNPLILMPSYATYSIADIDYPAVAFCSVNRISKQAVKNKAMVFYKEKRLGNATLEQIEKLLYNYGRLLDFRPLDSWDPVLRNMEGFRHRQTDYNTRDIIQGMKEISPNCKDMMLRCTWAGEKVDCMSIFQTRRTARGHCCAFNYVLNYDDLGYPIKSATAKRQALPGFMHGLNVIADPMLDDYAYPLNYVPGFDVLLFEPTHFADPSAGRVVHRLAEPNRLDFLELKSYKQTASHEVRKYSHSTRKCIFQDEMQADYHDLYSYSTCIIRCRVRTALSLCQCTPYFLPSSVDDGPICRMADLPCLYEYKEKLTHINPAESDQQQKDSDYALDCPDCLPDCENTRHVTKSYKTSTDSFSIDKYFAYGFAQDINMTNKCVMSIYFASQYGDLERLDVVSYWYQIVSNIGGFGGVLVGISVFTLVEIVFFLFIRFTQVVYTKYYS